MCQGGGLRAHHNFQFYHTALSCIRNTWTGGSFAAATLDAHISRFTAVRELLGLKREMLHAVAKEQHATVHDAFMPLAATDSFVVRYTGSLPSHMSVRLRGPCIPGALNDHSAAI